MNEDFEQSVKEHRQEMKSIRKFAFVVIILNLVVGLGFIAGVCWIVKYFFFN